MTHLRRTLLTAAVLSACLAAGTHAQQGGAEGPALTYDAQTRGPVPIPPSERGLQTVVAEPWFKVSNEGLQLEGASFERDGNLLFVEVFGGRVFRLTPDKQLSTVVGENKLGSAGLGIHKDGRIFIAGLGNFKDTGSIVAVKPDGSGMQTIVPSEAESAASIACGLPIVIEAAIGAVRGTGQESTMATITDEYDAPAAWPSWSTLRSHR